MARQMGSLQYKNRQFLLDGKPFTVLSGAMHYFRIPPEYWKDRLLKLKACGLNTVETYVPWNLHEEVRGEFNFQGLLDVRKYIQMAKALDLKVIFRPGPYICSEWDFGGLPSWLLHDPDMKLRSNYPPYQEVVTEFFEKLIPLVTDLQYSRGGPIIMVQVENEFGSYSDEIDHLVFIKDLLVNCGITETLVLSDNVHGAGNALLPQAFLSANFPDVENGSKLFEMIRGMDSDQPLMAMEYWTGWFDHWGRTHHTIAPDVYAEVLKFILEQNASVNLYMFHGGTNFGFMAGANYFTEYQPDVTSYDYDAVLSEAGDMTPKFYKTQQLIQDIVLKPKGLSLPEVHVTNTPKAAYGSVKIETFLGWEDIISVVQPLSLKTPTNMENLDINNGGGQSFGYVLYRKSIHGGGPLTICGYIRDRAQVLVDGKEQAVLDFKEKDQEVTVPNTQGKAVTLDITVENLGRVNYVEFQSPILNNQRKGLSGDILLCGERLREWQVFPLQFKKPFLDRVLNHQNWVRTRIVGPCMCRAELTISGQPSDSFLRLEGWNKGIVFINGFHLGRYWSAGPQKTLYVPGPVLKSGSNQIVIFEQHKAGELVTFEDHPDLG